MVNLLSNDVNRFNQIFLFISLPMLLFLFLFLILLQLLLPYRFDLSCLFMHYLWCGPLQLIIVTALLFQRIGPSALVVSGLVVWFGLEGRLELKVRVRLAFCMLCTKIEWH